MNSSFEKFEQGIQRNKNNRMPKNVSLLILTLISSLMIFTLSVAANTEIQPGIDYFSNAEYSQAYTFLDKLKSEKNSNAEFHFYYGLSLFMTDQTKQALSVMERAVELQPGNAEYHYALARIYAVRAQEINYLSAIRMSGKYRNSLREVINLNPRHVGAMRALASYLFDFPAIVGGDKREGQALLLELRKLDQAAAAMVEGRVQNGSNFELAEQLFLTAINTPGTDSTPGSSVAIHVRTDLGLLYVRSEEYGKAIPFLEQAIDLPRHWSEISEAYRAPMMLAVAYHYLDDDTNFTKYALLAEQASIFERDRKDLKGWLNYYDIDYEYQTFR